MKVLAATDGSPLSDIALDEIARRPWPQGSELKIVTVIDTLSPITTDTWAIPAEYYEEIERASRERGAQALASARERVAGLKDLTITTEILSGSPARRILDEAERWGADLVVVGSHGYGAVKRLVLGSVSHAIALHAPCSVEVVREHRAA